MHSPKIFLLFFVGACFSGMGFTYVLYQRQAKAYSPFAPIAQLDTKPSLENPRDKLSEAAPSAHVLKKDFQIQYTQTKPVRRLNKLSNRLASAQYQQEALSQAVGVGNIAYEILRADLSAEKAANPLLERLSANTLSSLELKNTQNQSKLEQLEATHSELEEELEQLQTSFLNA